MHDYSALVDKQSTKFRCLRPIKSEASGEGKTLAVTTGRSAAYIGSMKEGAAMVAILLAVIGCYVIAAVAVHLAYRIRRGKPSSGKHYILVAGNDENKMEWYMRSLLAFSRRMGTDLRVTVVDQGSTDHTMAIAGRFSEAEELGVTVCSGLEDRLAAAEENGELPKTARSVGTDARDTGGVWTADSPEEDKAGERREWGGKPMNTGPVEAEGMLLRDEGFREEETAEAAAGKRLAFRSRKRFPGGKKAEDDQLIWALQAQGVLKPTEQPVLVDLRNEADLSKIPF